MWLAQTSVHLLLTQPVRGRQSWDCPHFIDKSLRLTGVDDCTEVHAWQVLGAESSDAGRVGMGWGDIYHHATNYSS